MPTLSTQTHETCASSAFFSRGFSLVEMMISMTIGLIVIGAAGQLFLSGKTIFNLQQAQAAYQDQTSLLGTMISGLLRQSGHLDIASGDIDRKLVFTANTRFPTAGQVIKGVEGTASRTVFDPDEATTETFPNDSITIRFEGGNNTFECTGNDAASGTYYENTFLIRNNQLVCIPSPGADAIALVGTTNGLPAQQVRILGMEVLYGIDQTGDGSVNDYNRADEMSASNWLSVVNSWLRLTIQTGDLPPTEINLLIKYSNLS